MNASYGLLYELSSGTVLVKVRGAFWSMLRSGVNGEGTGNGKETFHPGFKQGGTYLNLRGGVLLGCKSMKLFVLRLSTTWYIPLKVLAGLKPVNAERVNRRIEKSQF